MTFSISARCPETGAFGVAISSSSPAVAARCVHLRQGVGAVASQNITDPMLGVQGLDLIAAGASAEEARAVLCRTAHIGYRQLALVDRQGGTAVFSGAHVLGIHGTAQGAGVVAAGNMLATPDVPKAMVDAFAAATSHLADRLLAALRAGLDAGGEAGPVHSAGLSVVGPLPWRTVDLRIDWHDAPIAALEAAWQVYKPQMDDYIRRASDPATAPSYGVAGDP